MTQQEALFRLALFVYNNIKDKVAEDTFAEWYETTEGWSFYPICKEDKLVAVVTSRENEVHVSIDPEYKGKWLDRKALKDILGSIIEEYGSVRTYVDFDCEESNRFVKRLGFERLRTDKEEGITNYILKGRNYSDNEEKLNQLNSELVELKGDFIKKLFVLEEGFKKFPQINIPERFLFAKGVCVKEVIIPKDTLIISRMQRFSGVNIISKGDVSVLSDVNKGWERMKAPYTFESPPCTKRAIYTHEETVWTNMLATEETDLAKLKKEWTIDNYKEYLTVKENLLLGGN